MRAGNVGNGLVSIQLPEIQIFCSMLRVFPVGLQLVLYTMPGPATGGGIETSQEPRHRSSDLKISQYIPVYGLYLH